MVRDDVEACLMAYQFAELLLAGFATKPEKEQQQALEGAARLRDEVEPRFELVMRSEHREEHERDRLRTAKARLSQPLEGCQSKR